MREKEAGWMEDRKEGREQREERRTLDQGKFVSAEVRSTLPGEAKTQKRFLSRPLKFLRIMIMVNLMGSDPTAIAVAICPTTVPHEAFDIVFSTLVRIGLTISCYIRSARYWSLGCQNTTDLLGEYTQFYETPGFSYRLRLNASIGFVEDSVQTIECEMFDCRLLRRGSPVLASSLSFGDLFGSDGVDGSVFDSTVSSHGFVFAVVMYVEHRVRDVSIKGDQQIAFGISLECLVTVCSYSRSKQIGCIYGAAHDGWMNNAITIRGPIDDLLLPCSDMMSMRSIPSDQCISA
ncbi:hypothetical protein KCU93_g189, partial [Aureobasidium melanogenum]